MQTAEDRHRLVKEYSEGQLQPVVAVLKCAAGIAILFAVAAGPWLVLSAGGSDTTAQAGQRNVADLSRPVAESRRVFEERQERLSSSQESKKAALAK